MEKHMVLYKTPKQMKFSGVAEITCESNGNIFSFFSQPKGLAQKIVHWAQYFRALAWVHICKA